jgi:hypothetical protein
MSVSPFVLSTYRQAREIVEAFARPDGLKFVIMLARPGVGKSVTFFGEICRSAHLIEGGLSSVKLFCRLFEHRDKPIVFDDVDELFDDKANINLMKCLGQTDDVKRMSWDKASHVLKENGAPQHFKTTSRTMIFANKLGTIEENMGAVLDRALTYRFDPSPYEVHREVGRWFKDAEIYDFVGQHLASITTLSMRHYEKAEDQKRNGLNWREWLLHAWQLDPKFAFMLQLLREKLSPAERQKRFLSCGMGAEATFKRYQADANRFLKVNTQAGQSDQLAA